MDAPIIPGSLQSHCRSSERLEQSIEDLEFAEHHGHSHRHWQTLRSPSAGWHIELGTELVDHRIRLVDPGIGLETAG